MPHFIGWAKTWLLFSAAIALTSYFIVAHPGVFWFMGDLGDFKDFWIFGAIALVCFLSSINAFLAILWLWPPTGKQLREITTRTEE